MRCREDRWYRSVDYRLYPNATQTKALEHTLDILSNGSGMRTLRQAVNGQPS